MAERGFCLPGTYVYAFSVASADGLRTTSADVTVAVTQRASFNVALQVPSASRSQQSADTEAAGFAASAAGALMRATLAGSFVADGVSCTSEDVLLTVVASPTAADGAAFSLVST
jgi:hypothetical protein